MKSALHYLASNSTSSADSGESAFDATLRILGPDCFEGQALCFQTALQSLPKHLGPGGR
jgi:hypothetical protein